MNIRRNSVVRPTNLLGPQGGCPVFGATAPRGRVPALLARLRRLLMPAAASLVPLLMPSDVPAAVCRPGQEHASGHARYALHADGRAREYQLYVPEEYDGRDPWPVVLDLHASGIEPATELAITGSDRAAARRRFLLVAPRGDTPFPKGGRTWNVPPRPDGPDDVAYVAHVLDDVARRVCIDPDRVYAMGFSGGARLASELACRIPERIAAVSAVGGNRHPGACAGGPAVPILAFHSVDDPVNPYVVRPGESPAYWTHGTDEAVERWARANGCGAATETRIDARTVRIDFAPCTGAPVTLYRLSGEGHTWPGSTFAFPNYLGAMDSALDATALSFDFFAAQRAGRRDAPAPEQGFPE